ncbi:DUF4388 domain-containing protein [Acidobacteriota bacterium]
MAISGELKTMPLADILQWILLSRKTGMLTVESGAHTSRIFLQEGQIITTSSTDPRSYLGQFILAFTDVTEEQLRDAFEEQEESRIRVHGPIYTKTLLGRILVEKGIITKDRMQRILQIKAEETIYSLFLWEQGIFTFEEEIMPPHELVPISIDLQVAINQGIRRLEEWKRIRAIFPHSSFTLKVNRKLLPADIDLDRLEKRIIDLAEQDKTIEEITYELHCFEFKVLEILYRYQRDGIVVLDEERALEDTWRTKKGTLEALLDDTRHYMGEGRFEDCIDVAQAILEKDPTNREARDALARSEKEMIEELLQDELPLNAIPFIESKPDSPDLLGSAERYFLERVARGRCNINILIKLSPLGRYQSLRAIKALKDKNLIALKKPGP